MTQIEIDAALIKKLGGPTKVALAIGAAERVSVQRVQNWLKRGIPPQMKVSYPHIFMPELAQVHANQAQPATESVAQGV